MKEITEEMKGRIAYLYQNTTLSVGAVAAALKVSPDSVRKYKDYKITVPTPPHPAPPHKNLHPSQSKL